MGNQNAGAGQARSGRERGRAPTRSCPDPTRPASAFRFPTDREPGTWRNMGEKENRELFVSLKKAFDQSPTQNFVPSGL